jgi:hypothetical protein
LSAGICSAAASSSTVGSRPSSPVSVALGLGQPVLGVDHVHRQPDLAPLVGQRAADRVADPPAGVGREAKALLVVVALDRLDEAEVALLDQVGERHAAVVEAAGDADDQPQVGLHEGIARGVTRARSARIDALAVVGDRRVFTTAGGLRPAHADPERQPLDGQHRRLGQHAILVELAQPRASLAIAAGELSARAGRRRSSVRRPRVLGQDQRRPISVATAGSDSSSVPQRDLERLDLARGVELGLGREHVQLRHVAKYIDRYVPPSLLAGDAGPARRAARAAVGVLVAAGARRSDRARRRRRRRGAWTTRRKAVIDFGG